MAQHGNASLRAETIATRPKGERAKIFLAGRYSRERSGGAPQSTGRRTPRSKRVDADSETRKLARNRVLVENAFGDRPMQFGLSHMKSRLGRLPIAGGDGGLDFFDEGAHPADPGAIDRGAL